MSLIPRLKPFVGAQELIAAMTPSKGKIAEFEQRFAEKFGNKYGLMFSHGRSSLIGLLKSWNLENDEIICPAYTCVVVQHAIVKSGNHPCFVDSENDSPNMDLIKLEEAINDKTRAVIVTHLFGIPMNVEAVVEIIERAEKKFGNKIFVVQDVAHAYGASWNGKLVTKYGDAAFFGSNISKLMTSVFGGMVITNSEETRDNLLRWRKENCRPVGAIKSIKRSLYLFAISVAFTSPIYALTNKLERSGILNRFVKYYDESIIDLPHDWDEFPCEAEARVGLKQLLKYDFIIEERRRVAAEYTSVINDLDRGRLFTYQEGCTYSHFPVIVENRDEWVEKLYKKGVQLGILVEYSVPHMKAYANYKKTEYPNSWFFSQHMINLPIWTGVDFKKVIDKLKETS